MEKYNVAPNSVIAEDKVNSFDCSAEKKMKKDDSGINVDKDDNRSEDGAVSPQLTSETATSGPSTPQKSDLNCQDLCDQKTSSLSDETTQSSVADTVKKHCDKEICGDEGKNDPEKFDPTPRTERPKYNWTAPLALLNRQYGSSVHYAPDLFRYNCYGSLHMAERLELMYKMKGHEGCVNALHFNAGGTKLASGSDDLGVIIWDWTTSEILLEYSTGHSSNVFQAKFLPFCCDSQVVSCARDGQVRIAELTETGTCNQTRKLAQHRGAAHKLAVPLDSPSTFLSCGEDATVFEIDLREDKPEKLVICKENARKVPLYSIAINPSKPYEYVVCGRDHFIRVYDKRFSPTDDGFLKKFCPQHLGSDYGKVNVTSVVYNYNGSEILGSFNDEDIYLFDNNATDTSSFLHRYVGHRNSQTVKGVNFFGPKSEFIVSGSDCGYIFFWEKESEHIVKYMHGDEAGVVNCLEPNPNMPVLATSGLDDDIKIWVPSCEVPPDLSKLRNHLISNMKDREEERVNEPDAFDDQVLWFLMQHLRRSRQQLRDAGDSPSSSSTDDSDEQDPGDFDRPAVARCNQS